MKCKILYFGKFTSSHSTENYVTYALRRLGQDVIQVDHDRHSQLCHLMGLVRSSKAHVVLFSKARVPHIENILSLCKTLQIATVCWQWDLYFGCCGREQESWPQLKSDLLFTTDGGNEEKFKALGCQHQVLRQGIHYPEAVKQPSCLKYDVGFVGHREPHIQPGRSELVAFLEDTYKDKFVYTNNTRGLALNKWLSEVKVVVGDCYPTPNGSYWSNRVYETLGRGGFLLHPEVQGLEREFKKKVHFDTYTRGDFEELKNQIDYYVKEDDLRESIRLEGHNYCKENYTYEERCKTLLAHIGAKCPYLV